MRKKQRSPAQIKQTESLSPLRRAHSHPDHRCLHDALVGARADIRDINRLSRLAQDAAKREIRNARKREQRALQKTKLATTKDEELRAQVAELTHQSHLEEPQVGFNFSFKYITYHNQGPVM